MKKIKWRNVVKLIVLGVASCELIYVAGMLMFYTLFTGNTCTLTWTGIVVSMFCMGLISMINDDFREQMKKTPKVRRQYK